MTLRVCNAAEVVAAGDVRKFVQKHLGSLGDKPLRRLAVGDFSTWLIDEAFVIRFALNDEGDRQLRREAAALKVIAPRLNISVPSIVFVEPSTTGHLASGYPLLRGASGEEQRPRGAAIAVAAEAVAECLHRLHATDPTLIDAELPKWSADYEGRLEAVVDLADVVRRHAAGDITPTMEGYLDGTVDIPGVAADAVLCHTDLKGEHVLLHPRTQAVTALIDWADVAIDDPAVDIGSLAIWLGEDFVRSVAASYGASPEVVARGLFRIRTWILTGYARMLIGENSWPRDLVRSQVRWAFRG